MKEVMENIGTKNFKIKVEKGSITMKELADQMGVAKSTVNYWLNAIEMDEVKQSRMLTAIKEIKERENINV